MRGGLLGSIGALVGVAIPATANASIAPFDGLVSLVSRYSSTQDMLLWALTAAAAMVGVTAFYARRWFVSRYIMRRLLPLLAHVALADGHLRDREIRILTGIATKRMGFRPRRHAVRRSVAAGARAWSRDDIVKHLSKIPPDKRTGIMQCAYLVALADGPIRPAEQACLDRLASALELRQRDRDKIFVDALDAMAA